MLNNLHLKSLKKESFKKQRKQPVMSFEIKLLIKLQDPQKPHHRVI